MRLSPRVFDIDGPDFDERIVVRVMLVAFTVIAIVGVLVELVRH